MSDFEHEQAKAVDRQIREANARGVFADNPLAGRPLPNEGKPYSEDWWLRELIEREEVGRAALPVPLALRREAQDLRRGLVDGRRAGSETALREAIADYDVRADKARRTPSAGPSVVIPRVEVDEAVAVWREGA
jgi:hypothetical protein